MNSLKSKIRDVPDFPKEGIVFKDITPLLQDGNAFRSAVDAIAGRFASKEIDLIVGAESRGFIFGAALAYKLGVGFVPARKPGKLPHKTHRAEYVLEYGLDSLEMHQDAVAHGEKVLVVDDLLATGGTAKAKCDLVEMLGGKVVGVAFVIELSFLKGREKLKGYDVFSLINYESE